MRKRVAVAAASFLMLCVVVRGAAQDSATQEGLEGLKESLTKTIDDNAKRCSEEPSMIGRHPRATIETIAGSTKTIQCSGTCIAPSAYNHVPCTPRPSMYASANRELRVSGIAMRSNRALLVARVKLV